MDPGAYRTAGSPGFAFHASGCCRAGWSHSCHCCSFPLVDKGFAAFLSVAVSRVVDVTALMEDRVRPGWCLSGEEILAELDMLHDAQTRLLARRLELLRRLDDLGCASEIGARDTSELISLRHRLDRRVVRRDLRTAQALDRYRTVAGRLEGECADEAIGLDERRRSLVHETVLNPAQAAVITEILDRAPASALAEDLAVAEAELVIAARNLLPADLRRLGAGVLTALDPDGPAPTDGLASDDADRVDPVEQARAAQTLWYVSGTTIAPDGSATPIRGLRIGGFLTGEHAELLQVLIDAGAKPHKTPSGELDVRTLGQRRADAFGTVLRAAAATGGELPSHGGIKPHLSITIPLASLDVRERSRRTGAMVFGEPLSADEVRRIACDAGIIPIVLGGESQPLDVGREQRLVTPPIRRALIARDGGCVIDGCGAPPGHCDAHHLVHWADGGPTNLENLALVCPPHHRAIHRGTWHVSITNGQVHTARPPWADPPGPPRPLERFASVQLNS